MSSEKKPLFAVLRSVESFKNPRPSIKKRMADGKALRKQVSIAEQGVYTAPKSRIDPVTILEEQAKQRIQSLIPIRYERMLQSPFAFYRGGAAIRIRTHRVVEQRLASGKAAFRQSALGDRLQRHC